MYSKYREQDLKTLPVLGFRKQRVQFRDVSLYMLEPKLFSSYVQSWDSHTHT